MKTTKNFILFYICLVIFQFQTIAQDNHDSDPNVILHVNSNLDNCDFDIASNLSQSEWSQATKEVGNAIYLNAITSPKTLGKYNWSLFMDMNSFKVDQESGAWNNTFHHPDSTHYLTGSNHRLSVPGLRFQFGITNKLDAGIYYTTAKPFGANYSFIAIESKYMFQADTILNWYSAVRLTTATDGSIKDFNIWSTGIEFTTTKQLWKILYPYAGVSMNWNHGRIVSNEVNLMPENNLNFHGVIGAEMRWKFFTVGYELFLGGGYNNRNFKIGVVF